MKKTLLLTLAAAMCGAPVMMADEAEQAGEKLIDVFLRGFSPDGSLYVSESYYTGFSVVNRTTGQSWDYELVNWEMPFEIGYGRAFTSDNMMVGVSYDEDGYAQGSYWKNGEIHMINEWSADRPATYAHGVTPDGSRIVGIMYNVHNVDGYDGTTYLPVYWELQADGTYSEPILLCDAIADFTGRAPQYVTAISISEDGKTVVGQMVDFSGALAEPVLYTEDAEGNWTVSRPAAAYVNPNNIEIPEYPGDGLVPPDAKDYMDEEQLAAYNEAKAYWASNGYKSDLYPNEEDYLSEEQLAQYQADLEAYYDELEAFNEKFEAFSDAYYQAIEDSPLFVFNSIYMTPDAKTIAVGVETYEDDPMSWWPVASYTTFELDLASGNAVQSDAELNIAPSQLLPDGTVLASTSLSSGTPRAYIKLAGASEYQPIEDYIATFNAEASAWLVETFTHEVIDDYDYNEETQDWEYIYNTYLFSGVPYASDDLKVIGGGMEALWEDAWEHPELVETEYGLMSWLIEDKTTGIKNVAVSKAEGINVTAERGGVLNVSGAVAELTVYDAAGRTLYTSSSVGSTVNTGLPSGIYMVKADNKVFKVAF